MCYIFIGRKKKGEKVKMRKMREIISVVIVFVFIISVLAGCRTNTAVEPKPGQETAEKTAPPVVQQEQPEEKQTVEPEPAQPADSGAETEPVQTNVQQKPEKDQDANKDNTGSKASTPSVQTVSSKAQSTPKTAPANKTSTQKAKANPPSKSSAPKAGTSVNNSGLTQKVISTITAKAPKAKRNSELDTSAFNYAKAIANGNQEYNDPKLKEITGGRAYMINSLMFKTGSSYNEILSKIRSNVNPKTTQYGLAVYPHADKTILSVILVNSEESTKDNTVVTVPETKPTFTIRKDVEQKIFAEINKQRVAAGATALSWNESLAGKARAAAEDWLKNGNCNTPGNTGNHIIYNTSAGEIKEAAEEVLKTIRDLGSIPLKEGSATTDDPDRVAAKYPYPLLQDPAYKTVGVGVCERKTGTGSEYEIIACFSK
jgi:hypothetical protein